MVAIAAELARRRGRPCTAAGPRAPSSWPRARSSSSPRSSAACGSWPRRSPAPRRSSSNSRTIVRSRSSPASARPIAASTVTSGFSPPTTSSTAMSSVPPPMSKTSTRPCGASRWARYRCASQATPAATGSSTRVAWQTGMPAARARPISRRRCGPVHIAGQPSRTSGSSSSGRPWARVRLAISVSRPEHHLVDRDLDATRRPWSRR